MTTPHKGRWRLLAAVFVTPSTLMTLLACTPSASTKTGDPPSACTKAGDTCTFSPGKLGVCTQSSDGTAALVCQSLH